jgi:hypothetical protein
MACDLSLRGEAIGMEEQLLPPLNARAMAIIHVAMLEAVPRRGRRVSDGDLARVSGMEGVRSRCSGRIARAADPAGALGRLQVGSTPILLRHHAPHDGIGAAASAVRSVRVVHAVN